MRWFAGQIQSAPDVLGNARLSVCKRQWNWSSTSLMWLFMRCGRSGFKTVVPSGANASATAQSAAVELSQCQTVPAQTTSSKDQPLHVTPSTRLLNSRQSTAAALPTGTRPMGADFTRHIGRPWSRLSPSPREPRRRPPLLTCPWRPP